ncbi:SCO3242 family prenyltransferase [Streptomyces sp. NBC_00443]|uniref:SCO3242 family prenyltransferase n=1 Tax=Streptomyces sp. NBC_00443 TaxID=2975743 RepID=UPI002E1B03A0
MGVLVCAGRWRRLRRGLLVCAGLLGRLPCGVSSRVSRPRRLGWGLRRGLLVCAGLLGRLPCGVSSRVSQLRRLGWGLRRGLLVCAGLLGRLPCGASGRVSRPRRLGWGLLVCAGLLGRLPCGVSSRVSRPRRLGWGLLVCAGPLRRLPHRASIPASPPGKSPRGPSIRASPLRGAAVSGRRAWAELLRLPALFTVPGDALSGAVAAGGRPNSRTLLAIGSSLCLYEAGMALNDWADRAEDAAERPHRPLPSGRIRPSSAFTAACVLTVAGLGLAARAGRPALAVATPLAATVWAYDLALKHTPAGPVAMAAARGLDHLLGAATTGRPREALPSAALLGTHTLAVTTVSRRETQGGTSLPPLAALAATAALTGLVARGTRGTKRSGSTGVGERAATGPAGGPGTGIGASAGTSAGTGRRTLAPTRAGLTLDAALRTALATAYAATAGRPYTHAALNPSPPLTQRAVGGGIRATIPLQAALAARAGSGLTALAIAALAPIGRKYAKKVSVT